MRCAGALARSKRSGSRGTRAAAKGRRQQLLGQTLGEQDVARRVEHRLLDDTVQFAHVAGPIVFLQDFQGFRTPDDNRKFEELYGVQRLTSNTIGASSKVVITTIQRLYAMLRGEELDESNEEASAF